MFGVRSVDVRSVFGGCYVRTYVGGCSAAGCWRIADVVMFSRCFFVFVLVLLFFDHTHENRNIGHTMSAHTVARRLIRSCLT